MIKRSATLICMALTMIFSQHAEAQYTVIGRASLPGSLYGPTASSTIVDTAFSRHAYIYRNTVLGDLKHDDTIRSIEFFKYDDSRFNGNLRFRIYLDMSDTADFGFGNINWTNESQKAGCKLVYEGNPTTLITDREGFYRFEFNRSGGKFAFDTTRGAHLKILVEFIQYTRQTESVSWFYENNITVPAFISGNETKYVIRSGSPTDSTTSSNVRKPTLRINFPRYDYNLSVHNVYALGKVPRRMVVPDSIKAHVINDGLKTTYNRKFYLNISGANLYTDSTTIDSMVPYKSYIVTFPNYSPVKEGKETLLVYPEKDSFSVRDSASLVRQVNYNVFAHTNPYQPMDGGVGFDGSSGDFVAIFYSDTGNYINQISVTFFGSGQPFQLGIWERDTNGLPGKEIYMSDTLITKVGEYILPVLPRVKVGKSFFAGIRQDSTRNIAFGFQYEEPVRPGVFYFTAPAQNTQWVPFSPGYDFNFNIQPRIQVENDVSVVRAVYPEDGEQIELSVADSIAPEAMVYNYGFADQKVPFDVICEITNQFGQVIYKSTKQIVVNANDSTKVVFDSTFRLYNNGTNTMRIYTKLFTDRVFDNDTITSTFDIVIRHDVSADIFFEPLAGANFQLNRDSIWPVVRILNNGILKKDVTKVGLRVYQGNYLINQQIRFVNLDPQSSEIIAFDTIVLTRSGVVTFEAHVYQSVDSFRSNDTIRITVNVIKDDDIAMLKIIRPIPGSVYNTKTTFKPFVDFRNVGRVSQDSVLTWCEIYDSKSKRLYRDSAVHNIILQSTKQALFKDFTTPGQQDTLTAVFWTYNENDQDPSNDTMISVFYTAIGNDLLASKINIPVPDTLMEVGISDFYPSATFINQGLNSIAAAADFKFFCSITRPDNNNISVYEDTVNYSGGLLAFGDSVIVNWTKVFDVDSAGTYQATVWHNYAPDELQTNDSTAVRFNAARLKSIILDEVLRPQDSAYELNGGSITPQIVVMNNGLQDIPQFTTGGLQISKDQQVLYNDDFVIGPLKSFERKTVTYESSFTPAKPGKYDVVAWIENDGDLDKSNDTIRFSFNVYVRLDVAAVAPVYPGTLDTVEYLEIYKPTASFMNAGDSAINATFTVSYQIFEGTTLHYNSNKSISNLGVDETRLVEFDSSFKVWFKGIGTSVIIARYGFDQNKENDTLIQNFVSKQSVGIKRYEKLNGVSVYPNPVTGMLKIRFDNNLGAVGYNVSIYSATGIKMIDEDQSSSYTEFDMRTFAKGMYFVRIITKDGRTSVLPVLKD